MKKMTYFILVCLLVLLSCKAHKSILYTFEQNVNDSLQAGVRMYSKLCNKPYKDLKLYAIIFENNGDYEICIQEFSSLGKSGMLKLIKTTDRKLVIGPAEKIPVLVPSDNLSTLIKKDKIVGIPLGGYYLKIVKEKGEYIVLYSTMSY